MMQEAELLTLAQAGKVMNLSRSRAHELAVQGVLPAFNTPYHRGRMVYRADVLALVARWREEGLGEDTVATTVAVAHAQSKTTMDKTSRRGRN